MMPAHDHLAGLSLEDERRLEEIVEGFEVAWIEGPPPRIEGHLPPDAPLRLAALVELVYVDQEYAAGAEAPASLDDYLARFPELGADPDLLCEVVARDFRMRGARGESPSTEEYAGRFPGLGGRLEARLKAESTRQAPPGGSTVEAAGDEAGPDEPPGALPDDGDPRYVDLRFHARGGLGSVYRGHDVELAREVALKRIRRGFASQAMVRRRFLREARLTARLAHPGVVPIHGLIWDRHDQPWYVMRFIEGVTLARAIAEHHAPPGPSAGPDDRALAFRNLLARFVAVCDTIAFAHSRDVVHRDLKPSNVIFGEYGETIVLDWGLATTARAPLDDRAPPTPGQARGTDRPEEPLTLDGQVLGTPVYMSPEQAKGLPGMNLPGSDVYALGAILYTILAGRPPFRADAGGSLPGQVARGDCPPPRQVRPEVPRALDAICRKAMAPDPAGRYESAGALARDVERWAAGEPVGAWREPWPLRARRWAGRHRTGLAAAGAAAAVALLLLGAVARGRAVETARADASALATLDRAEALAIEARASADPAAWGQAIAEGLRALERLEAGGSPGTRARVDARVASLRAGRDRLVDDLRGRERDRRVVAGLDEARLRRANLKGNNFDDDAMHDAYLAAFRGYGIDLARESVGGAARRIRSSRVADDLVAGLDDWARFESKNVPNEKLWEVARAAEAGRGLAPVVDALASDDPSALRRLCQDEGARRRLGPRFRSAFNALLRLDPSGSFPLLEAIRRESPADFWLNHDLGVAYVDQKPPRFADALRCLSVAVALRPASPGAHVGLGNVFQAGGDVASAVDEYRMALRLDPGSAVAHSNLAFALQSRLDYEGAASEGRIAIGLDPGLGEAHNNLGVALQKLGDLAGAVAEFRRAVAINPRNARAHSNLGNALQARGDLDDAIAECRLAIGIDPGIAETHNNLGVALRTKRDLGGAVAEFRLAIGLDPESFGAHTNLGFALKTGGDLEGAIAEYRAALRINPGFPVARNNLGQALMAKGDLDGAAAEFRQAIRADPSYADGHNGLALTLRAKGDLDGAIAECKLAVGLDPGFAEAHCLMGLIERGRGRHAEALAHFTKGHEVGTARGDWAYPSAQWVADARRVVDLEARLPAILKGEDVPKDAAERLILADSCLRKGLPAASARFFGEAFAERPALADDLAKGPRYGAARAAALAGSGRGRDDPPPDEAARAGFRAQALAWLRADLAGWSGVLKGGDRRAVASTLARWLEDPDLAGLRDQEALARRPEGERESSKALWAEVEALRKEAGP